MEVRVLSTMNEVGEKGFLKLLLPKLFCSEDFVNGFGHDASIIDLGLEKNIAFKIDRAPSPVSVKNLWSDYKVWGRLAVVANVSDLVASGANAKAFMLSLVVPGEMESESVEEIVKGCAEACQEHGVSFVGGDTKEGAVAQVVGACIGTVDRDCHIGRKVASAGDRLVVAGKLGGFLGAYHFLKKCGLNHPEQSKMLEVLTRPSARVTEGRYVSNYKLASAGCDLSDGLADALSCFCDQETGVVIEESWLPMHMFAVRAAAESGVSLYTYAFGVGDWAIAYVVPEKSYESHLQELPEEVDLVTIGFFNSTGEKLVKLTSGELVPVPDFKNEHFRSRLEDEGDYLDFIK